MDAISDSDGKKDSGMSSQLDESISRSEEKQVAVVGLLKFHDLSFEFVLMLLQGVTSS